MEIQYDHMTISNFTGIGNQFGERKIYHQFFSIVRLANVFTVRLLNTILLESAKGMHFFQISASAFYTLSEGTGGLQI